MARPRTDKFKQIDWYPKDYNPALLIEVAKSRLSIKTDIQLSEYLEIEPNRISNLRRKVSPLSANLVVEMMDVIGMSLEEIKSISGLTTKEILGKHKH